MVGLPLNVNGIASRQSSGRFSLWISRSLTRPLLKLRHLQGQTLEFDNFDQLSQTYLYRRLNIPLVLFVSRYCLAQSVLKSTNIVKNCGMFQFFTIRISDRSRSGFLFLAIVCVNYLISTNDPANTGNIKFECLFFIWTFTNNKVMLFFFVFVFCLSTVNIFWRINISTLSENDRDNNVPFKWLIRKFNELFILSGGKNQTFSICSL